jgi:hypothetical protein
MWGGVEEGWERRLGGWDKAYASRVTVVRIEVWFGFLALVICQPKRATLEAMALGVGPG